MAASMAKIKLWRYANTRPPSREVRETCKWDAFGQILHRLRFWPDFDRTDHKTNLLIGLVVIYAALNVPENIADPLRGEIGRWVACVTVIVYIFFPMLAPEDLDIPAALVLLIASTPKTLAMEFKKSKVALSINVAIGIYLFYQHIQQEGFRKCVTDKPSLPITIGIILMLLAPIWEAYSVSETLPYYSNFGFKNFGYDIPQLFQGIYAN